MKAITPKRLILMAMFVALQIVLSKFLMLQLSGSIRLSIDSVPILLAGIWFGPIAGGIVGAFADLLGTLLFPTVGAYYPPLTIAFFLIGFSAGLISIATRKLRSVFRAALIVVPSELIGSFLFKSIALSLLIGIPFCHARRAALPVAIVMVVNTILVTVLDRMLGAKATQERELPQLSTTSITADPEAKLSYEEALKYIHHVTWRGAASSGWSGRSSCWSVLEIRTSG
ncbi:MAG: folate family ECF transporter S component [Eubacteriales bacterium]